MSRKGRQAKNRRLQNAKSRTAKGASDVGSHTSKEGQPGGRSRYFSVLGPFVVADGLMLSSTWFGMKAVPGIFFLQLVVAAAIVAISVRWSSPRSAPPRQRIRGRNWAALGAVIAVWPLAFVLFGYFYLLSPENAMAFATTWWLILAFVLLPPFVSGQPLSKVLASAISVAVAGFPIIGVGVQTAISPVELKFTALAECDPQRDPQVTAMQYFFRETPGDGTQMPSSDPGWKTAKVVAFLNGQSLEAVEWPPLMQRDQVMYRRYLTAFGGDHEGSSQRLDLPVVNSWVSALTMGLSRPSSWSGHVTMGCYDAEANRASLPYGNQ